MSRVPTLFLDFDGVLHPSIPNADQTFSRLPILVSVLDSALIDIVISSSWRFHRQWDEILALFPPLFRRKVVGCTGAAVEGKYSRFREIEAYVRASRIQLWCALDDSEFEFPAPCEQLVLCDGSVGVTESNALQVLRKLGVSIDT